MSVEKNVLKFINLIYKVKNKDKNIHTKYATIINGLSGKVESGKITAVMGENRCNKTHLFKLLIGNLSNNCKTSGLITYNGKERDWTNWTTKIAFLPKNDIYYPHITLYESIMYNLSFNSLSKKENEQTAIQAMKNACIFHKKDAIIQTLSGGERKQAMIAVTLANNPEILILDEPTTGLDSNSALNIVESLKKYAEEFNKIVIMTVHQPGKRLYNLFGDLIFLTRGGLFYTGEASGFCSFLQGHGLERPETSKTARKYKNVIEDIVYKNAIKESLPEAESCNNHTMFFFDFNIRHSLILFKHNLKLAVLGPKKNNLFLTICKIIAPFYFISFVGCFRHTVELFKQLNISKSGVVLSFTEKFTIAYQLYTVHFLREVLIFSIFFSFNKQESTILNLEIFTRKFSILSHTFYNFLQRFSFSLVFLTLDFCFYMFMNRSGAIPFSVMGLLYLIIIVSLIFTLITNLLVTSFPLEEKMTTFLLLLIGVFGYMPHINFYFVYNEFIVEVSKHLTFVLTGLFLFPNFNFDMLSIMLIINQIANPRNDTIRDLFTTLYQGNDVREKLYTEFVQEIRIHNNDCNELLSSFIFLNDYTWLKFILPLSAVVCLILSLFIIYLFKVPNIRLKLMN